MPPLDQRITPCGGVFICAGEPGRNRDVAVRRQRGAGAGRVRSADAGLAVAGGSRESLPHRDPHDDDRHRVCAGHERRVQSVQSAAGDEQRGRHGRERGGRGQRPVLPVVRGSPGDGHPDFRADLRCADGGGSGVLRRFRAGDGDVQRRLAGAGVRRRSAAGRGRRRRRRTEQFLGARAGHLRPADGGLRRGHHERSARNARGHGSDRRDVAAGTARRVVRKQRGGLRSADAAAARALAGGAGQALPAGSRGAAGDRSDDRRAARVPAGGRRRDRGRG